VNVGAFLYNLNEFYLLYFSKTAFTQYYTRFCGPADNYHPFILGFNIFLLSKIAYPKTATKR
jgi:hypothetical protein